MPLDASQVRDVEKRLLEKFGLIHFNRLAGRLGARQLPSPLPFPELDADPDPPAEGVIVYCIDDDGAGKRELRALFPTGAFVPIVTEP